MEKEIAKIEKRMDIMVKVIIAILITFIISTSIMLFVKQIRGDVDGNRKVNENDLALLRDHLDGTSELPIEWQIRADMNNDGYITIVDFAILEMKLGE
jgi:hypothetical protein